jgi:hypothetical protein
MTIDSNRALDFFKKIILDAAAFMENFLREGGKPKGNRGINI